jgi:hypothetical protein
MESVQAYKTNDGKLFADKVEAQNHERETYLQEAKRKLTIACQEMLVSIDISPTPHGCELCAEHIIENIQKFSGLIAPFVPTDWGSLDGNSS